ncbi:OmpH family outer membrane protein [Candidatus Pelagibacter sp.]|jgi:Skp family chaperone for outer membrane proteins|nr:OmpH family outer membrane protein [Candidatus Pelagibacter sp.]
MKNKFFLILIFFFLPLSNFVKAEVKIAFIDMEQVINTSNVGLKLIKKIELMDVKFKEKFSSNEINLKKKEKELFDQKNILNKDEFDKKLTKLKNQVKLFNEERSKEREEIIKLRNDFNIQLLKAINVILTTYSQDNNISILLQKKNIILGSTKLDITKEILNIVNKNISENDIK